MKKDTLTKSQLQEETTTLKKTLDEIIQSGVQQILALALEAEVQEYLDRYQKVINERGHRLAVRNGSMPERTILSSVGPISIRQPRVDDRQLRVRPDVDGFSSEILPKYLRRTPSLDNLIPALYLRGISTQDFPTALSAILGDKAKSLSANTVVRLKEKWETEYKAWARRDLSGKHYAYIWADGIYFNVRLKDVSPCILVIIGANEYGQKELLAVKEGFRESELSWKELLLELKDQGLEAGPELAIADGALGFWKALPQVFPKSREQRCWVHKTANILDKMPKSVQANSKRLIHEMYMAETKENALTAYHRFIKTYEGKYPKAVKCLEKNYDQLFTFYDFPAMHWQHIRTTNPIESTFATVRLRTRRTKGCGSSQATLTMVFKLVSGEKFIDGEPENQELLKLAA